MERRRKCSDSGDHFDPTAANIKRYAGKDAGLGLGPLCAKFKLYAENLAMGGGQVRTGGAQATCGNILMKTIILENRHKCASTLE